MKKITLLLILLCFTITMVKAQVPTNNLIENAIEITTSDFSDGNLRLDLASPSAGGQGGCNLSGFNIVYYKFTANATATAFLYNEPATTAVTGNFFAIFYYAPNLNVTSETDLTIASLCQFGNSTLNMVSGQSYYLLVARDTPSVTTNVRVSLPQNVSVSERTALMDLYNATDGLNWVFNTNWGSSLPVSTWRGVTVENGSVVRLIINSNNLTGTLPSSLTDLTSLEDFSLIANNLSGEVPDLSVISSLTDFNVRSNNFSVGDLETHFTNNSTLSNFTYTPQLTVDSTIAFEPVFGSNYTLSATPDTGTNVSYQWYKERTTVDQNILILGATNATYDLTNIQLGDLDTYRCEITSTTIPDLTISVCR